MRDRTTLESILASNDTARRWTELLCELGLIDAEEHLSEIDHEELVDEVEDRISHWLPEERIAPEAWMYDVSSTDVWEYGVNGIHSEERFDGFVRATHWLFPLATSVRLTDYRLNLRYDVHVRQFCFLDIWMNILYLYITGPVSEECRDFIISNERFRHMESIMIGNEDIKRL